MVDRSDPEEELRQAFKQARHALTRLFTVSAEAILALKDFSNLTGSLLDKQDFRIIFGPTGTAEFKRLRDQVLQSALGVSMNSNPVEALDACRQLFVDQAREIREKPSIREKVLCAHHQLRIVLSLR